MKWNFAVGRRLLCILVVTVTAPATCGASAASTSATTSLSLAAHEALQQPIAWVRSQWDFRREVSELRSICTKWIGQPAPELGLDAVDRLSGPVVTLQDQQGKVVVLFAFDAGNFVESTDHGQTRKSLQSLNNVRGEISSGTLAVIGFTAGPMMFPANWGIAPDVEYETLTRFPLVCTQSRNFPAPYNRIMELITYSPRHLKGNAFALVIDVRGRFSDVLFPPVEEHKLKAALRKAASTAD